jgi:hypothetical protein
VALQYHAAPLSPAALASGLYSRNLDDPELRAWMKQCAGFQTEFIASRDLGPEFALVEVEGMEWEYETAVHGASERLAPVLMTALVTALGLLPLAIGSGAAGRRLKVHWPLSFLVG